MMKKSLLLILLFALVNTWVTAQKRYVEPVFTDVSVNTVIYGYNYTVLAVPLLGKTIIQPLVGDVYQPDGDTETARPLVLYFHSGNFLPYPDNGGISGTRSDSTVVEMSRRLSSMGYVVASLDHRLGWNPLSDTLETRVNTLINAAYRGVQDARTAIRYFKANAELFRLDTNKIVIIGQGTGGYISLNTGCLDSYAEVLNTTAPVGKFISTSTGLPYVHPSVNGDIYGTSLGIVPSGPLAGDTLCIPNHEGHTSNFQLMVNLGGALGDIAWLDANSPPVISFHSPTDPFAPYQTGVLFVPPPINLPIVEVQGSYAVQEKAQALGINAAFENVTFIDDISAEAASKNSGFAGLYPIQRPADRTYDSSPWDYWDPATNINSAAGYLTNPDMTKEKAVAYMDTIIGFFAPRACLVLGLDCDLEGIVLSNKTISADDAGLMLAPNPANDMVNIFSETRMMKDIKIFDAAGRLVQTVNNINATNYQLQRNQMPDGVYFAQVRFDNQVATLRFIFGSGQ